MRKFNTPCQILAHLAKCFVFLHFATDSFGNPFPSLPRGFEVLQICLSNSVLWISHSMWRFRITMQNCFMMDFFLWSSTLHLLIILEAHSQGLHKVLPHSWLASMIKKLPKTPKLAKNWLKTFARVLNVPIKLKGINYYSKVFKRVYNKL